MNTGNSTTLLKPTKPIFIQEAAQIHSYLKEKSPKFLSELMEISPKLADENWERNQKWKANPTAKESAPAMYAFTGEVYRGLDAATLDKTAVDYLRKHYRILSGLYGLLRPSDRVMLYRLEMGRKFEFENYENLYDFWREKITAQLNSELLKKDVILNLASSEYIKSINSKKIKASIINFDFFELKTGKPKTVVVYTKHARGLMVRHCAEIQAKSLDDVKSFSKDGYLFNNELSTEKRLVFTR